MGIVDTIVNIAKKKKKVEASKKGRVLL